MSRTTRLSRWILDAYYENLTFYRFDLRHRWSCSRRLPKSGGGSNTRSMLPIISGSSDKTSPRRRGRIRITRPLPQQWSPQRSRRPWQPNTRRSLRERSHANACRSSSLPRFSTQPPRPSWFGAAPPNAAFVVSHNSGSFGIIVSCAVALD